MSKNSGVTQTQLFIIFGLVTVIFFILGAAIFYVFAGKEDIFTIDTSSINFVVSPTESAISPTSIIASPTNLLQTATPIPTFAYLPTFTQIPSPTSFVLSPDEFPAQRPQQSQNNPAPSNPPSANSSPNCSAELDYVDAMHNYYLDSIDYIHSPMIEYYQYAIDEAARSRDALSLVQAQRGLDSENAQVSTEKKSENKRYKAERARIIANCQ